MAAYCEHCDRTFSSDDGLQQHVRDSRAHDPSLNCQTCKRTFSSNGAVEQHLKTSRAHQLQSQTPLDIFFSAFHGFEYNPFESPAKSYARLQKHQGWNRNDAASKGAWNQYQNALKDELQMWYGSTKSLTAWHALCRAIGINPLPPTRTQCKKVSARY